jgi:outer membrane protein assembly factor BamC
MVRHHFASALACALCLTVAGCGALETKKIDYKSAGTAPTLEVPPDLTAPSPSDRFAMPESGSRGSATLSTYNAERQGGAAVTESRDVIPATDAIRVERAGNERWLVIRGTNADELWPRLRNFWVEMGFVLNVDSPDIGVMETDWAEDRAKLPQDFIRRSIGKVFDSVYSVPERDKFRTRIEQGAQPGSLDVFISHRGMVEIYTTEAKDSTVWQPRPVDPELEAEMLRRMMVYLGAEEAYAQSQLGVEAAPARARIETVNGAPTLTMDDVYARAWRRVGLALDRVGFTVQDRNRADGVYYVRYIDPQADVESKRSDKGWLSSLAFWRSDDEVAASGSEYRIQVSDAGNDRAQVGVQTKDGAADTSATAGKIIQLLYEQLK